LRKTVAIVVAETPIPSFSSSPSILWGAKISVLPANRGFPAMRTEFWHPTR
jgi:hypothetical protein